MNPDEIERRLALHDKWMSNMQCAANWAVTGLISLAVVVLLVVLLLVVLLAGSRRAQGAEAASGTQVLRHPDTDRWRVTAYCPCRLCCGPRARGVTASGTRADHPLVAAPREISFAVALRIPGYAGGSAVRVEDRGGAIRGRRLDVLYPTHEAAWAWGVRWLIVIEVDRQSGSEVLAEEQAP